MPERDYYDVLGVRRDATADQIKRAHRKLAKQYHPDRNPHDKTAEARFKEVQAAYDVVGDPDKRRQYDQFGPAGVGQEGFATGRQSGPAGQQVYTWRTGGGPDVTIEGLEDLFEIFSGMRGADGDQGFGGFDRFVGRHAGRRRRASRERPTPPPTDLDLEHTITLTFDEAIHGTTREIRVIDSEEPGRSTNLSVRIPAGVNDGQRIRLAGKGRSAGRGAVRGNLYIICRVQPHPYFRRLGSDILLELPLSITEAALGARIEIPTLDGRTILTVPPGTPSGAKLRLKGKGVRPAGKAPPGDLYVIARIIPPKSLTPRQRQLLEQLRDASEESPRESIGW